MYKPVIDKIISQRADEFAQREYMADSMRETPCPKDIIGDTKMPR